MNTCARLESPPATHSHPGKACFKTRREVRLCVTLAGFLAILRHHAREALAYLASSLAIPIQPAKLLTIPLFDTF
jgi:hypothetical protein